MIDTATRERIRTHQMMFASKLRLSNTEYTKLQSYTRNVAGAKIPHTVAKIGTFQTVSP